MTTAAPPTLPPPLGEVLVVLERLTHLHEELHRLTQQKLQHLRAGKHAALGTCAEREAALIQTITDQNGLRRQLFERLGRAYGIAAPTARRMSARDWAARLEEPLDAPLRRAADRLREAVSATSAAHRQAELIVRGVLYHLRQVFAAVSDTDREAGIYSPRGEVVSHGPRRVFELTG